MGKVRAMLVGILQFIKSVVTGILFLWPMWVVLGVLYLGCKGYPVLAYITFGAMFVFVMWVIGSVIREGRH